MAKALKTATLATTVVSILLSLVLGGSMVMLWGIVNTLQITSLMPLLSFQFPGFLLRFFYLMNDFNLQFFSLEDLLENTDTLRL